MNASTTLLIAAVLLVAATPRAPSDAQPSAGGGTGGVRPVETPPIASRTIAKQPIAKKPIATPPPVLEPPAPPPPNGQAVIASVIPADALIDLRRIGSPTTARAANGMTIQTGDLLTSQDPRAMIELRCANQPTTVYRLQAPFRILLDPPDGDACHVNILKGRGEVIAESPTATTGGGIGLKSRGTQYSVDVIEEGDVVACHLVVFEGIVDLRKGGEPIVQGRSADWSGATKSRALATAPDFEKSATLNARFDVYAARLRAPNIDTVAAFRELKQLQYEVLAQPTDTAKRINLAKRQIDLKVDEQAAYNLKRANVTTDSALLVHKINPAVIRASPTLRTRVLTTPPAALTRSGAAGAAASMLTKRARVDTLNQHDAGSRLN